MSLLGFLKGFVWSLVYFLGTQKILQSFWTELESVWCVRVGTSRFVMYSDKSRPPEGIRFCLVSTRSNLLLLSRMLIYCPEFGNTCAKPHYKFSSGKIALSSLQSEVFWWGFCNSVPAQLHILLKLNWLLNAFRPRSTWGWGSKKLISIAISFLEFWCEKVPPLWNHWTHSQPWVIGFSEQQSAENHTVVN